MDIDEELREFLENVPRKAGQLKLDGTPRKMAELDPILQSRNQAIILDYYGFGTDDQIMPTYEALGENYGGLTRERVRQLIARNYRDHLDGPLTIAKMVDAIITQRDFWLEADLLQQLQTKSLIGDFPTLVGIIDYLKSQGLSEGYTVCHANLEKVTRNGYAKHAARVICHETKLRPLKKHLKAAYKVPGLVGLGKLSYVKGPKTPEDFKVLKDLIVLNGQTWSALEGGELWYIFENSDGNSLINAAEKVFFVVESIGLEHLTEMLSHSLRRRAANTEFPSDSLIRTWIMQSRHFVVEDGLVRFKGTPGELGDGEETLCNIMRGRGAIPTPEVTEALVAEGLGSANIGKLIFNSPLLFIDKKGGRGNYLVTLASDLSFDQNSKNEKRYDRFKGRLSKIGNTDQTSIGTRRREQSILADWIFGEKNKRRCAICQRKYSKKALVVAHKKKRSQCSDSERLDPHIVFPLCIFGCDYLYEHGFLKIVDGQVQSGNRCLSKTERSAVDALVGIRLKPSWANGRPEYFCNG